MYKVLFKVLIPIIFLLSVVQFIATKEVSDGSVNLMWFMIGIVIVSDSIEKIK